ncbi:MAG: osmoprotectant transport system substrate-binding protein opuBD [Solirubrobacteraceae bacterium]|jgi:glycine betaine/choline ABC-type transport system substrate-binding protein|nr:osmoprotectant transport system substrate-binding protein opuBD [Solirubrobacteraceae bacterium]
MNRSPIRILFAVMTVIALGVVIAACGSDKSSSTPAATTTQSAGSGAISASEKTANKIQPVQGASSVSLTVGSKNFPEQYILGEIYAQALQAAGYKVKKDLDLGPELVAYKALRQGTVDAYPEYTGTALTAFFKVKIKDVPKDSKQAYQDAKAGYAKVGITAFSPTPFENSYRLGMTKKKAAELGNPTKISDLKGKSQDMVVNGFPACRQRIDCLLGVEQGYGLKFKKFLPGENKFQILDNGDADVAFVFTTDGPLSSGKYVVLDDDKSIFPPYNISFTMRDSAAKKLGASGQKVISDVQKYMTVPIMQELNARFDIDKEEAATIAADYLKNFGFVAT